MVWFGEAIDPEVIEQCHSVLDCELFVTVGTSSIVYPAAELAFEAKRRGAFTVEINLEATPASDCLDLSLQGPAEVILDEVERRLGWRPCS